MFAERTLAEVIYHDELRTAAREPDVDIRFTLTREQPDGWDGYDRRIDRDLIADAVWAPADRPLVYVCGPTAFVEVAADALVSLGHDPGRIRTERFGPTGR